MRNGFDVDEFIAAELWMRLKMVLQNSVKFIRKAFESASNGSFVGVEQKRFVSRVRIKRTSFSATSSVVLQACVKKSVGAHAEL
jgi:hypothetical protein